MIDGGAGSDNLLGGNGADHFLFNAATSGNDRIVDFDPSVDQIHMTGVTRADLTLSATDTGLTLSWADGSILLDGIAWGDFSVSLIEFS